jgi:hypothetical protein
MLTMPAQRDVFRCPRRDNRASAAAPFGAKVNNPIGCPDDIKVVFNDDQRVPSIREPIKDLHEPIDVGHVQPRCWFVQHIQHVAVLPNAKFTSKFDALCFAT